MAGKKKVTAVAASPSGVKRNRNEPAASDDENDFEDAPIRARTKQAAPSSVAEADAPGEMMDQCRIFAMVLCYIPYAMKFLGLVVEIGINGVLFACYFG